MAVLQHRLLKSASCLLKQCCTGCVNRSPSSSEKALWAPPHLLGSLTRRSAEDLNDQETCPSVRQDSTHAQGWAQSECVFPLGKHSGETGLCNVEGGTFTVLPHLWDRVLFETKTMAGTWLELGALKHERTEILNMWNVYSLMLEI